MAWFLSMGGLATGARITARRDHGRNEGDLDMDASPQAIGSWPNAGRSIRAALLGVSLPVSTCAGFLIALPRSPRLRRGLSGYALAAGLAPLLTLVLALLHAQLTLTTDVLAFLVAVIALALLGGLGPALLEVVAGLPGPTGTGYSCRSSGSMAPAPRPASGSGSRCPAA